MIKSKIENVMIEMRSSVFNMLVKRISKQKKYIKELEEANSFLNEQIDEYNERFRKKETK